jgi:phosphatidylinositol-3-phosphatase
MENEESTSLIGNGAAPYINGLASSYGLASQYYGVSHPSLPNYLALTAGSAFGINSDCTTCRVNAGHLADQIEASGRSWKAYLEGMPSACFLGDSYPYMQKHNPWIYYNDIRTNAARCNAHVVPFSQLGADLAGGSVANYVWITPNMCSDMHDCSIATGDSWLSQQVPAILNSTAFRNGGVLFITWDEGSTTAGCCTNAAGGRVATPGDLATGTHRISIHRAGDALQPAEDDRGFLEATSAWWRELCLHGPNARILSLKEPPP